MKQPFTLNLTKKERMTGIAYIPIHAAGLPYLLIFGSLIIFGTMDTALLTAVHYSVSFFIVLALFFRYLRDSFTDMCKSFGKTLKAVLLGFGVYFILQFAMIMLLNNTPVMGEINPNQAAIAQSAAQNFSMIAVVAVLLAPIVEEVIFRGALFGSLRLKSRILAYVVSAVVFSMYHLWPEFVFNFRPELWLFLLQYVPGSIAIAWSFERGGTIWSPIFLHALINFIGIRALAAAAG